jgi:hypothetical protein
MVKDEICRGGLDTNESYIKCSDRWGTTDASSAFPAEVEHSRCLIDGVTGLFSDLVQHVASGYPKGSSAPKAARALQGDEIDEDEKRHADNLSSVNLRRTGTTLDLW